MRVVDALNMLIGRYANVESGMVALTRTELQPVPKFNKICLKVS